MRLLKFVIIIFGRLTHVWTHALQGDNNLELNTSRAAAVPL